MSALLDFTTPRDAVRAMLDAGAVLMVRARPNALSMSLGYTLGGGGDLGRCREILASVKGRALAFVEAFRAAVQDAARVEQRRCNVLDAKWVAAKTIVDDVSRSPTSAAQASSRDRRRHV